MANYKLLIVEDDDFIAELITNLFKRVDHCSFQIYSVNDGQSAYEYIQQNKVDLVLTDLNLPVKNGFELLFEIRNYPDPDIKSTPVIILSTEDDPETIDKSYSLNVDHYIQKPYDLNVDHYIQKPYDLDKFYQIIEFIAHFLEDLKGNNIQKRLSA